MKLPQRRQPTQDEVTRDAAARNGARDFATALFLMILCVIAIDGTQAPTPTAQEAEPQEKESKGFVDYLEQIAEVVL